MMRESDQIGITIAENTFKVDCLDFLSFVEDFPVPDRKLVEGINEFANKHNFSNFSTEEVEKFNIWSEHKMVAIYTSNMNAHILKGNFADKPKLITIARRVNPNHYPSAFGKYILKDIIHYENRAPEDFIERYNGKYVAVLAKIFNLTKNDIEIWNEFCTNGLFNIWNPVAPYNRLNIDEYQVDAAPYNLETRKYDISDEMYVYKHEQQRPDAKILLLRIFKLNENDIYKANEIESRSDFFDTISPRRVRLDNPVMSDYKFNCIYSEIIDTLQIVNPRYSERPDYDAGSSLDHGFVTTRGPYKRITGKDIIYIPKEERFRDKIQKNDE